MVEVHFIVATVGTSDAPDVRPIRDAARSRRPLPSHVELRRDIRLAAQLVDEGLLGHARFFELLSDERGFEACHASLRVALHVRDSEELDETFDRELSLVFSRFGDPAVFEALAILVEDDSLARCQQMRAFLAVQDAHYRKGLALRFVEGDAQMFDALICSGDDGVDAVREALPEPLEREAVEWAMSAPGGREAHARLGLDGYHSVTADSF